MTEPPRRLSLAFQGCLIGILVGLLWKWPFFRFADIVNTQIPIEHAFFPDGFRDAAVARSAYFVSLAGFLFGVVIVQLDTISAPVLQRARTLACGVATLACVVLLCHQSSYNDVTFLMAVWCGTIATWYSHRMSLDDPDELLHKAANLSRVVISLMFLGGLVGKCTPEYWSGQVLYEIYFIDRDFWFFNWLRDQFQGEDLRSLATTYSRVVIVTEAVGALAWGAGWVFSSRAVAVVAIGILVGIGGLSNFQLFSVLAPLIGLACIGIVPTPGSAVRSTPG